MTTTPQQERIAGITQLWSEGDYRRIAALFAPISHQLVDELEVAGLLTLDAATGTGNTALALAKAGAEVDAFDLTPALLEHARQRAANAHVDIRFREGDLTAVLYPDASFDLVISTFGAFLADDPMACARELVRVCRPGGRVVTTAWAGDGVIGSWSVIAMERHPELFGDPAAQAERFAWSDPERVPELFAGCDVDIRVEHREIWFPFASTTDALEVFEATSGPIMRLRSAVQEAGGDWDDLRAELVRRWDALARPADDGIRLPSTYAVAFVGRRA